jgi:ABC-type Na+ efflux pump permease subunit
VIKVDTYFNTVGLIGVVMMVVAFFFLQTGKMTPQTPVYLWLNLIGAIAVMISLFRFWNLSSFVIECFWAGISAWGLLKTRRGAA